MVENSAESVVFIAGGAAAGAGVSATVGGMGLAGGFGAIGIGMAPVTVAGAVAGAAAYGAFKAIADGDSAAFGAVGIGALGGAGVSATVGGMGLAGGFGAVSIGMGSMAAAGGVIGLGLYGIAKLIDQSGNRETAAQVFNRMEEKVLWQDAYTQALLELELGALEVTLRGNPTEQKFAALEMDAELEALKAQMRTQAKSAANSAQSSSHTPPFTASVTSGTQVPAQESQFTPPEIEVEVVSIEAQPAQPWKCVNTLKGHSGSVNSVTISPNGQTIASGSDDRTVNLWNLKTGKRIYTFLGQAKEVHSVAISPDGQMLASGSFDQKVTSWKLDTKEFLRTFFYSNSPYSHSGFVFSVVFSPDGQTLVSGGDSSTIKIWRQMLSGDKSILDPVLSGEWWEVLGVGRDAYPNDVKGAYRRLARQYHPDINRSASAIAKMQAINKAYEEFLKAISKAWL